jgi:hypothetical protein
LVRAGAFFIWAQRTGQWHKSNALHKFEGVLGFAASLGIGAESGLSRQIRSTLVRRRMPSRLPIFLIFRFLRDSTTFSLHNSRNFL